MAEFDYNNGQPDQESPQGNYPLPDPAPQEAPVQPDRPQEGPPQKGQVPEWNSPPPQGFQAPPANFQSQSPYQQANQPPYYNHDNRGVSTQPMNGQGAAVKKKHTGRNVFLIIVGSLLFCLLLALLGFFVYQQSSSGADASKSNKNSNEAFSISPTPDGAPKKTSEDGELTTESVAEKIMPSMVGIAVYTKESAKRDMEAGEGSGIIMTSDGYIVTNAHVVVQQDEKDKTAPYKKCDKIEVYLNNDECYSAEYVGIDIRSDLAVIKIDKKNLIPAEFGESDKLNIGERAIAIGNPTGRTLSSSLTQGIISGVDRSIPVGMSGYSMNCIQTDAAINPGNSGGALVNRFGQVVGINSLKIAAAEYEGIGFAIPIHIAKPILDDLMNSGYVSRPKIGFTFQEISEATAELRGIPAGLRVNKVDENTDAYAKGVQSGDIITHMDGKQVLNYEDCSEILSAKKPGEKIKLTIYRDKNGKTETIDIEVTLAEDSSGKMD